MDKDQIIQLTNKLYRLTLLFPKKEPLRYKIRDIADNILSNLIICEVFDDPDIDLEEEIVFVIKKDLEIIDSYLEVAKWQNWVSFFDILEIQQEYAKTIRRILTEPEEKRNFILVEQDIEEQDIEEQDIEEQDIEEQDIEEQEEQEKQDINQRNNKESLDSRKEKILDILKEKGKVQVGQVSEILPEVSKRTIRRDFVQLLEQGLIERIGDKNDTFYQLRNN